MNIGLCHYNSAVSIKPSNVLRFILRYRRMVFVQTNWNQAVFFTFGTFSEKNVTELRIIVSVPYFLQIFFYNLVIGRCERIHFPFSQKPQAKQTPISTHRSVYSMIVRTVMLLDHIECIRVHRSSHLVLPLCWTGEHLCLLHIQLCMPVLWMTIKQNSPP